MELLDSLDRIGDVGGPAQPLLTVSGLRKHFSMGKTLLGRSRGAVKAVDGVDFVVRKGETLGVVGESGCGKSTMARLVSLLMPADDGQILYDGQPIGGDHGVPLREYRRCVQMVFQDSFASLNPRLTIADTIAFGPMVHGMPRMDAGLSARLLLDKVGLAPRLFAQRFPHELSGGQRQRVNIARALAFNPNLVVLDEAVAALDKSVQAQVLNLLLDLRRESDLTYIFISHDLSVVRYLSDRVVVMYLGKVVEVGSAAAVYEDGRHPYTSALLASAPSMDPARRTLRAPLEGDPPNPINPPSGCRFRDRCVFAEDVCAAREPALAPVAGDPDHQAACFLNDSASGHSKAVSRG